MAQKIYDGTVRCILYQSDKIKDDYDNNDNDNDNDNNNNNNNIIIGSAYHPLLAVLGTELRQGAAHDIRLKAYEGASGCCYTFHVWCQSTAPQLDVN